jgi:biopolymer transport protein ExbB/TolQ
MATTPTWILLIGWATRCVLVFLLFLSVWSGSILIDRRKKLGVFIADPESGRARELIRAGDNAGLKAWALKGQSLQAAAMREVLAAPQNAESIAYAQRSFLSDQRADLSRGLSVLATLGSNAPFIGLFGTVLGIIQSFGALATSTTAMNQVISSLAEALIATAFGLFVAIPAVVGYNVFSGRIKSGIADSESLRDLYLSRFVLGERR